MADKPAGRFDRFYIPLGAAFVALGLVVIIQGLGREGSVFFSIGAIFVALGVNARQRNKRNQADTN